MRRALFIDLDGTLADSIPVLYELYCDLLRGYGVTPSPEEFQELNGPPLKEGLALLKARHGFDDAVDQLYLSYLNRARTCYRSQLHLMPGASCFLHRAHEEGYLLALVTSCDRSTASQFLQGKGIDHLFSFLVAGDDVRHGKPNPEPYLRAIETANITPSQAVAIEDSAKGVAAATAAGLPCIWFAYQKGSLGSGCSASLCVASWSELTPAVIDDLFLGEKV